VAATRRSSCAKYCGGSRSMRSGRERIERSYAGRRRHRPATRLTTAARRTLPRAMAGLSEHARRNREFWDARADEYQREHAEHIGRPEPRWGMWQLPESELGILGDVERKDVLELGCGAAQWAILLAGRGARVTGLDNSARQLEHARAAAAAAEVDVSFVHASAEDVPLPDATFDVVFCDHGALTFADPYLAVPEAARLLRPQGLLAFSHSAPWEVLFWSGDKLAETMQRDYFGLHRIDEDGSTEFNLPLGEWIALFRRSGLEVEDLVEVRPPEGASSTYRDERETAWARRWPMEQIWRLRKR
jgi:SAM-dependent methyltransferase